MKPFRKTSILLILAISLYSSTIQAQSIIWQKCLGGSGLDYTYASQQTTEGGYINCGFTGSADGNIIGNHGGDDIWIQKLDADGKLEWQKCLGGNGMENGWDVHQTSDGNYIVAGFTNSNDGDVSGNHGYYDAWIAKIDTSGNVLWQKCFGGSNLDEFMSVQQTSDGGYIASGLTNSTNGDVSGLHGGYDYWVVKMDASGNMEWQKCLGGSSDDYGQNVIQTSDNGYVITGKTGSTDGDVTVNHGSYDLWIVKLDAGGNLQWQKSFGGSEEDGGTALQQTSDGGIITVGYALSTDGNVSGNHGSFDFWVLKLDASGNLDWQKCLGGSGMETARSIQQTPDGGYLGSGSSGSNNGDVTGNHGFEDGWIVKFDSMGNLIWQKCIGGNSNDDARSVTQTMDGGYFVGGYTFSNSGNVSGNHGQSDAWAVKLTGMLNPPQFSPPAMTSVTAISFTITAAPGSTIYYTTDGTTPDCSSSLSGISPLTLTTSGVSGTYVYNVIACEIDWIPSGVATATFVILPTGMDDYENEASIIRVYPNPSNGLFHLVADDITEVSVILMNAQGQIIPCKQPKTDNPVLDISAYPKGTYFLKISGNNKGTGKPVEKTTCIVIMQDF